jgi:beta-lactamase regulating signal transducer with metallopeptidase domain
MIQLISLAVGLGILLAVVEMLRRRRVREKYAVLWLVVAVGQLGVCAHLSVEATQLEEETRTLAEEVAMLRERVDRLEADRR